MSSSVTSSDKSGRCLLTTDLMRRSSVASALTSPQHFDQPTWEYWSLAGRLQSSTFLQERQKGITGDGITTGEVSIGDIGRVGLVVALYPQYRLENCVPFRGV